MGAPPVVLFDSFSLKFDSSYNGLINPLKPLPVLGYSSFLCTSSVNAVMLVQNSTYLKRTYNVDNVIFKVLFIMFNFIFLAQ